MTGKADWHLKNHCLQQGNSEDIIARGQLAPLIGCIAVKALTEMRLYFLPPPPNQQCANDSLVFCGIRMMVRCLSPEISAYMSFASKG